MGTILPMTLPGEQQSLTLDLTSTEVYFYVFDW